LLAHTCEQEIDTASDQEMLLTDLRLLPAAAVTADTRWQMAGPWGQTAARRING